MKSVNEPPRLAGYFLAKAAGRVKIPVYWRLIGVAGLCIYALLLMSLLWYLLHNLIVSTLLIQTSLLLAYALWLVFSGVGRRKIIGYMMLTVSTVALLAEILYMFMAVQSAKALVAFVLLVSTYILVASRMRARYCEQK